MRRGHLAHLSPSSLHRTGLGTLQIGYPRYESLYDGKIVDHSHNDYLEALAETGVLEGSAVPGF